MSPAVAQRVFLVFNLVAVLAVAYVVADVVSVISGLSDRQPVIALDTGISYLLLMSVFWVLSVVQFVGSRNKSHFVLKYSNQLIIGWFIAMLLLAYFIPVILQQQLQRADYIACEDPRVVSRVSRGASLIFLNGPAVSSENSHHTSESAQICARYASNSSD